MQLSEYRKPHRLQQLQLAQLCLQRGYSSYRSYNCVYNKVTAVTTVPTLSTTRLQQLQLLQLCLQKGYSSYHYHITVYNKVTAVTEVTFCVYNKVTAVTTTTTLYTTRLQQLQKLQLCLQQGYSSYIFWHMHFGCKKMPHHNLYHSVSDESTFNCA